MPDSEALLCRPLFGIREKVDFVVCLLMFGIAEAGHCDSTAYIQTDRRILDRPLPLFSRGQHRTTRQCLTCRGKVTPCLAASVTWVTPLCERVYVSCHWENRTCSPLRALAPGVSSGSSFCSERLLHQSHVAHSIVSQYNLTLTHTLMDRAVGLWSL